MQEMVWELSSREAEEGEDEKSSMKNTVKLREIERGTKHLSLIYNG